MIDDPEIPERYKETWKRLHKVGFKNPKPKKTYVPVKISVKKRYYRPLIGVKEDYRNYVRDYTPSQARMAKKVFDSSFSIVILGLVLLVLGRFLFGSYNAESFDPSTVLPSLLEGFANSSWSTEYLMFTLRNFSAIEGWAISSSGILQALKTIVAIIGYAGNFLMLLSALLLNAAQVIFLIFKLLFVPL